VSMPWVAAAVSAWRRKLGWPEKGSVPFNGKLIVKKI
jgi:hypothetical protein